MRLKYLGVTDSAELARLQLTFPFRGIDTSRR